jgi:IS605 OrfB family transposase
MKLIANLKLCPTVSQADVLLRTLKTANQACNWISGKAWDTDTFKQFALHQLTYDACRERFHLAAQMVVRCIAKVADAYKLDQETRRRFKPLSAQPYDDRIFRFCSDTEVSLWTLGGRLRMPYQCGPRQRALLAYRKGEVDLMCVKGVFYLAVVCDVPDPESLGIDDVLGIDLGIVNLAFDSQGTAYTNEQIEARRKRYAERRKHLSHHGTRSARRHLRLMKGKQARFQRDVNHTIAKKIVQTVQRSAAGIALEDLRGIRGRVKARRQQRARQANWGFFQLRQYITYKAQLVGVPVFLVDPRHTSQTCPRCHHIAKANRQSQSQFSCQKCRFAAPADYVGARNIRAQALVNVPMVAQPRQLRLALA